MSDKIADRVHNASEVGMHPLAGPHDVTEGEHYDVLAYTDWGDMFVPTVVRWANGETDSFTSITESKQNKRESKQTIELDA